MVKLKIPASPPLPYLLYVLPTIARWTIPDSSSAGVWLQSSSLAIATVKLYQPSGDSESGPSPSMYRRCSRRTKAAIAASLIRGAEPEWADRLPLPGYMGLRYRPGGLVFVSINPVAWIGYVSPISDGLVW